MIIHLELTFLKIKFLYMEYAQILTLLNHGMIVGTKEMGHYL